MAREAVVESIRALATDTVARIPAPLPCRWGDADTIDSMRRSLADQPAKETWPDAVDLIDDTTDGANTAAEGSKRAIIANKQSSIAASSDSVQPTEDDFFEIVGTEHCVTT
jgi:hypothetical protein